MMDGDNWLIRWLHPIAPVLCPLFTFLNALTTALVITIIFTVLLVWLLARWLHVRRSLQWWQSQQIQKLAQEADGIRNGLLQDSFVVRRNLELLLQQTSNDLNGNGERCLIVLEQLHTSLKGLSDRLSPPYLEASLPLAIEHVLEEWRSHCPNVTITATLPPDWQHESYESHHFSLMVLDELLRLILIRASACQQIHTVQVKLQQHQTLHRLAIAVAYSDGLTLKNLLPSTDLRYLSRVFRVVTAGQCWQRQQGTTLICHFQWRSKHLC